MRVQALQARERRILALGILFAVLLLAVFGVVKPVSDRYQHYRDAIADLDFRLERLAGVAASGPAWAQQLHDLGEAMSEAGLLIERETAALAAADMQRQLGEVITRHGGQILSTQAVPAVTEQGLVRVGVRIQMTGTSAGLAAILETLESSRPLLFVDNLRVTIRAGAPRVRGQAAPAAPPEHIDVQFDAMAFMRTPGGGAS